MPFAHRTRSSSPQDMEKNCLHNYFKNWVLKFQHTVTKPRLTQKLGCCVSECKASKMTKGHSKVELQLHRYLVKLGNVKLSCSHLSLLSRSQTASLDQSLRFPLTSTV